MDGKNSSGRRISLLNDNPATASISPSLGSRTSSYNSSPIGSPPTPQLVRSNSSDSTSMQTPSPITPDFAFESLAHQGSMASPVFAQGNFFPMQKELNHVYPPVPQGEPLPYHGPAASQASYFNAQQATESHAASASANSRSKKNSYPCPMAKQYNCSDFFTTSGHAARHAKKHTGKKDAFCPECNKAFTRKDNMEQHRRTHQSGRNAPKGGSSTAKKAKQPQQAKRPKPSPIQSSETAPIVDPELPVSPASSYAIGPAVQALDSFSDFPQRSLYPDPSPFSLANGYSLGSSFSLETLAIACGEKRKFENL